MSVERGRGERSMRWIDVATLASGLPLRVAVHELRGASDGPTVGITAAIHGDELAPVEAIRRLLGRIDVAELRMALDEIAAGDNVTAVCQGFIGSGVAGEALLIFNESSFKDIAELMKYEGTIDESVELELLMDISNVLIGACLKGIVDQLDINFSQGHPMVLGQHIKVADLLKGNAMKWKQTFAIEMGYRIENRHINCDLLLLFTEDSMDAMRRHVWHLIE